LSTQTNAGATRARTTALVAAVLLAGALTAHAAQPAITTKMVDLGRASLSGFTSLDDSVFANSLRGVHDEDPVTLWAAAHDS
jgi:hypothetical protein